MRKIVKFLKETKHELKKVNWPTKKQVGKLTMVVVFITLVVTLYLGTLDFIFAKMVEVLLR